MSTKKPKAWRGYTIVRHGTAHRMVLESSTTLHRKDCTVIPDGAPLPVDRQVAAVIRAARIVAANWTIDTAGALDDALAKLDRKRGRGRGRK